jgi:hypothetical protein
MKPINFQVPPPPTAIVRPSNGIAMLRVTRALGALSLLVVGGVHLEQYTVAHFSVVPTIGTLFLANFIAATGIGLILLIPIRATLSWRRLVFDALAGVSGIAVAGGALVALLVSEQTPLFGFMEYGYRREIVIALASEAVAIVSLGIFVACAARRARRLRAEECFAADAVTLSGTAGPAHA